MRAYEISAWSGLPLPRSVLLDTNVIIAAFSELDDFADTAATYLQLVAESSLALVPVAVVVESWGMLVGSRGFRRDGNRMLEWLLDSSRVMLIPGDPRHVPAVANVAARYGVDVTDAWLLHLALDLARVCEPSVPIRIATFDAGDFYRLAQATRARFGLVDLRTMDEVDF